MQKHSNFHFIYQCIKYEMVLILTVLARVSELLVVGTGRQ